MNPKFRPTKKQLQLRTPKAHATLDEEIARVVGDPAYANEIVACLDWEPSRKQVEKALRRLLEAKRITRYGQGTRRLYASPQAIHPALEDLPSEAIRMLQYMPLRGAISQGSFTRNGIDNTTAVYSQADTEIEALSTAGLLYVARSSPRLLILSATGRAARVGLGAKLALQPITVEESRQLLGASLAGHLMLLRAGPTAINGITLPSGGKHHMARYGEFVRSLGDSRWELTPAGHAEDQRTFLVEAELDRLPS